MRNAAATTLLSLLLLLPSTTTTSSSSAGAGAAIDLPAILLPVFRALLPLATTTDAAGAAATAVDAERGSGATRGGESGATAAAAAAAVYLPTFLRLASSVLDRVLPPAPAIDSPAALLRPFGSLWTDDKAPRVEELWAALWVLAGSAEPGLRAPALNVLARVLSLWTHTRGKGTWARAQERAEALAWDALRALKAGRTGGAGCKPAADPELVQELEAVWTALGTALGATRADALAAQMADDWLSSASSTATLFPPATAAAAAATGAGAEDWGARRRTAAALAKLGPEVVGERALEALRVAPEAAAGADEPVARERAALLVGQCLAASGPGGSGGDAPAPQAAAQAAALQAALAEGLAALSQDDGAPRRVAVVAAAGLVGVGAASESPGPVMRALMEAVKAEADRERQGMAVDALVALVAALLAGDGKGRKAVEKAAGNLCVLACAMQQDDPARAMARGGAREALKGLMDRLGPGALDALPVLWPRIVGGLQGGGVGEAAGAEEAVRLLMVITPVAAEEGAALASIRSLAAPLVGLAIGAGAGVQEEEEEEGTSTTLVSLLASRCLVILLKRGRVGALAAQAGPLLNRALRDRGREAPRQR